AKQREEAELAKQAAAEEEERQKLEAALRERKEADQRRKAQEEQDRLEQEHQQREAEQRRKAQKEAEQKLKREEEQRQKREAEKRKQEEEEAKAEKERLREEEEAAIRKQEDAAAEAQAKQKAAEERRRAEEMQEAMAQREAERSRRGGRERRSQAKDEQHDKEPGEQPPQAKSLRQTLTPSQLRRQQRKRQKEARRAAEAETAAREENRSEKDESEEEREAEKPKPAERKPAERQPKQRERVQPEPKSRQMQAEKTSSDEKADTKKNKEEETKTPAIANSPPAEEVKAAPTATNTSETQEVEKPEKLETTSDLRSDAEAFTVSGSSQAFGHRRRSQEPDQNPMQTMMPITTLMITQIPEHMDADAFRRQLDTWGFVGTYNFFYMPPDASEGWGGRCVFINFEDPGVASMCLSYFQQCPSEGVAQPYNIQGLENNIAHFSQFVGSGDMVNGPLIVPTPTPAAWAINGAQAMMNNPSGKFSPQIRGQFHKTKMCAFHKKKKCTMGHGCPFAHTREELNAPPDLSKTKLCVNFFRKKCNDANCKFAHGHAELRATGSVYKTELCRAWATGTCKAGDTCRYAHGVKELRGNGMSSMTANAMGYMGYPMEEGYMTIDGVQMGCDVMGGLTGIWENEAVDTSAAVQRTDDVVNVMTHDSRDGLAELVGSCGKGARQETDESSEVDRSSDGTSEPFNDAMSDMGFSDTSTLCMGVVLRVKGTFMESRLSSLTRTGKAAFGLALAKQPRLIQE
ncbi:unnamed protein product, partial [Symbiodinium pilosum]